MIMLPKTIHCLTSTYGEFNETNHIGPAMWPHFDLIFIHEGSVNIELLKRDEIQLRSGQAVLIYPDTPFYGYSLTPLTKCSVHHFKTDTREYSDRKQGFETFPSCPVLSLERDIRRLVELALAKPNPLVKEMRAAVMALILAQLRLGNNAEAISGPTGTEFLPLIQWLRENTDKPIKLSDMAKKTNRSPSHFRACFKAQVGTSPGVYFLNMRLDEAARLLRETLLPIKEIAARVGYHEIPHFYRAFNARHETTPNRYRQKHLPLA